jgi:CheY-like chemotaxis protein
MNHYSIQKLVSNNAPQVLLVEDNPLIQHITQSLLSSAGFSVDIAGTGAEALEKFSPGKYDLVFMDIGLPDQDGYSVAQAIRKTEKIPPTPIIALTAHGAEDVEQFCHRAGMQGVLSKPLTREQADSVWTHYGLGKAANISGMKTLEPSTAVPSSQQIIDIEETIKLLGSKTHAEELLALWFNMLTQRFLPALKDLIEKQDVANLRKELHAMIGSLCYVKTPLLHKTVIELQTAARHHPKEIQPAYQHVLQEAERFVEEYKKYALS